MNMTLNGFSASCTNALALFALDRQRNIREMIDENEKANEFLIKHFKGFSRITVDHFPGRNGRKLLSEKK